MESMSSAIGGTGYGAIMKQHQAMVAELNENPFVKELRSQYPGRNFSLQDLKQYAEEQAACRACAGLEQCPNKQPGYKRTVHSDPNYPFGTFTLVTCEEQNRWIRQRELQKLIKSHNVPENIVRTTFASLEMDDERKAGIAAAMKFCADYHPGAVDGLYLYGPLGTGKSSLCGAICNELAKRGVDVLMVHVPTFLEEIKAAIGKNQVEEKLDAMRNASVLILDDIGAEPLTLWTRDGVIGTILQDRMEKKPTIYTSNLSLAELEIFFANVKDDRNLDTKKAARLMDRIEPFVVARFIGGRNRRRQRKGA